MKNAAPCLYCSCIMMRRMMKVAMISSMVFSFLFSYSQTSKEQVTGVGAEFRGILNLTIVSDPQIDFTFTSVNDYKNGITKRNAVRLEVDATLSWDLFAYASTDNWIQTDDYSMNGEAVLPAELLEIQSSSPNQCQPIGGNFNTFTGIKGVTNSGVMGGIPDANNTQFIAGMSGTGAGKSYSPGSARGNAQTNQFSLDYRIVPGLPASFPNSTLAVGNSGFAQAGTYYLEVVYVLVEDL